MTERVAEFLATATAEPVAVTIRELLSTGCSTRSMSSDDADFVFVQDSAHKICGIVTTADLSARFRDLTSPFFQLGEIEIRLHRCTRDKFSVADLRKATHKNNINSIDDMSLGNYVFLLKEEEMWQQTEWEIPQEGFLVDLRKARDIRNRIAHYDARPVSDV